MVHCSTGENGYFYLHWDEDQARYIMINELESFSVTFDNYRSYEVERHGNIFDNSELPKMEYTG